jgi:drug/metabolite transporter (DMT)-like permease
VTSAAAAATGILVGSAIVATRFVIDQSTPLSLALLRYLIGFLVLLPPALLSRRVRLERRDLLPIGLLGIAQFGILIALLNYALELIPAARAALVFATLPLLTMVMAWAVRLEPLSVAKTAGVLLTILGVGLALGEKAVQPAAASESGWLGELAVFGSALIGAACSVLYRPYLRRYPTLQVSAIAMLAAIGFLAVLAAGEGFFNDLPRFTIGGWLAVLFIGITSGVGYFFWLWALSRGTPTRVTVFLALSPVTAAVLGVLFLGEGVTLLTVAGLTCVAFGLRVASSGERIRPRPASGEPPPSSDGRHQTIDAFLRAQYEIGK